MGVPDDKLEWEVALVGFQFAGLDHPKLRQTSLVANNYNAAERARFYEVLLQIKWLPTTVRSALLEELGTSLREYKRGLERARMDAVRALIKQEKDRMRDRGERPRGGAYKAAVARIAKNLDLEPETLEKRLQRHRAHD